MKGFIQAFCGPDLSRLIFSTWNWLLGIPVEQGGRLAIAAGDEALKEIEAAVIKLTEAAAIQGSAVEQSTRLFTSTSLKVEELSRMATELEKVGDMDNAEAAATECVQYMDALPNIEAQMKSAGQAYDNTKRKLRQMQIELKGHKAHQQLLSSQQQVTAALQAAQINQDSIDGAVNTLGKVKESVNRKASQVEIFGELSEDSTAKAFNAVAGSSALDKIKARQQKQLEGNK